VSLVARQSSKVHQAERDRLPLEGAEGRAALSRNELNIRDSSWRQSYRRPVNESETSWRKEDADGLDLHRRDKQVSPSPPRLANEDSANAWFKEFDPDGVAFEHPVIGKEAAN
jgi:hypothetical protein